MTTEARSDETIRADLAVFFRWTDKPDPKWRYEGDAARRLANDVEPLLTRVAELQAEVERLRARDDVYRIEGHGLRAERDEIREQRDQALTLLADAIPDPKGAIDSAQWHRRMDWLATWLSGGRS